jgi:hypothetical protein
MHRLIRIAGVGMDLLTLARRHPRRLLPLATVTPADEPPPPQSSCRLSPPRQRSDLESCASSPRPRRSKDTRSSTTPQHPHRPPLYAS